MVKRRRGLKPFCRCAVTANEFAVTGANKFATTAQISF